MSKEPRALVLPAETTYCPACPSCPSDGKTEAQGAGAVDRAPPSPAGEGTWPGRCLRAGATPPEERAEQGEMGASQIIATAPASWDRLALNPCAAGVEQRTHLPFSLPGRGPRSKARWNGAPSHRILGFFSGISQSPPLGTCLGVLLGLAASVRNCPTVFQSGHTILRSHPQCARVPDAPHACQQLACCHAVRKPKSDMWRGQVEENQSPWDDGPSWQPAEPQLPANRNHSHMGKPPWGFTPAEPPANCSCIIDVS
ncbi:uncharacterized protein LOC124230721 [Equus quagga]|uniref:uncharacterized protein LOC124230721 n=1 Tax=Equus quagga TaxID=89248 RepID=UPI001EE1C57A|nr:uncharacterized protein LOC124230721 [Equus quagga]